MNPRLENPPADRIQQCTGPGSGTVGVLPELEGVRRVEGLVKPGIHALRQFPDYRGRLGDF
jgi:hypothetical protein